MESIELREYLIILKKRISLIIFVTLLAALISAIYSYFILKPVYKANISVIIGKNASTNTATAQNYQDMLLYKGSVKTYSVLATSRKVADDVISTLDLDMDSNELIPMLSSSAAGDTEFLTLTVKNRDPELAVKIANQLAKSLKTVSSEIKKEDAVQLVDDAKLPTSPDSPKPMMNIAIAFFLGLMLSIGISFLLEFMDNTVKSQEEIEKLLEIPVIGIIPLVDFEE
jgi:capsular polysaccharide biosynthesis protein